MSVRTLGRIVRKMERSTAASLEAAAWSTRFDAERAATDRIMACPEAHLLGIAAGEWMLDHAPRGADPMAYPEMVEKMAEIARVLEAFEAGANVR